MKVAIIPARGGSKRIPRKNIREFCGKPMLAYPIESAQQSGCFDRIVVSTEDPAIAKLAISYGAEVPFIRPAELADDYTGTTPIIRHALQQLIAQGDKPEYCCCIYATSPLLQPEALQQALQTLLQHPDIDFVFSAARFSFPIQRALLQSSSGGVIPFDPDSIRKRSQDLPATYHDAGQFYWGKTTAWLDPQAGVFSERSRMQILPDHLVQDIDTEDDWQRAELLYKVLQQDGFK
ncbi:pseudaminic acid cytidylyltransferase [Chromatiaceae bacterium AAb-1]|nr:pseudaminic acid cytidylyltransferase [Chromatiaceae bacterium AAb-1]